MHLLTQSQVDCFVVDRDVVRLADEVERVIYDACVQQDDRP